MFHPSIIDSATSFKDACDLQLKTAILNGLGKELWDFRERLDYERGLHIPDSSLNYEQLFEEMGSHILAWENLTGELIYEKCKLRRFYSTLSSIILENPIKVWTQDPITRLEYDTLSFLNGTLKAPILLYYILTSNVPYDNSEKLAARQASNKALVFPFIPQSNVFWGFEGELKSFCETAIKNTDFSLIAHTQETYDIFTTIASHTSFEDEEEKKLILSVFEKALLIYASLDGYMKNIADFIILFHILEFNYNSNR